MAHIPAILLCIHGNHEVRPQSLPERYHEEDCFEAAVMMEDVFPNILFVVDGEVYDIEGFSTIAIGGSVQH